ncbi:TetR/AcrR family transcriptional regulator, partial [Cribrihabitans sp. XS_ASV171]
MLVVNNVYDIDEVNVEYILVDDVNIWAHEGSMTQRRARPGGPTRKEMQSEETRKRLTDAARSLFDEFGYHAVSVTDIARQAGVSHGMINAYFHSKAGLLYHIIQESNWQQTEKARALAHGPGSAREKLRAVVEMFASHDLRDPELLAVMQSYFWTWPQEVEGQNRAELASALAPVAAILNEG